MKTGSISRASFALGRSSSQQKPGVQQQPHTGIASSTTDYEAAIKSAAQAADISQEIYPLTRTNSSVYPVENSR